MKLLEDWLCHLDTEEDFQEDVVMHSEEKFQPEEQLDEVGLVPTQAEVELTKIELSKETVEKQLSDDAI